MKKALYLISCMALGIVTNLTLFYVTKGSIIYMLTVFIAIPLAFLQYWSRRKKKKLKHREKLE